MMTGNLKTTKKCAFCKYWYDPTNAAISPKVPQHNWWYYDDKQKNKCLQKNHDTSGSAFCGKYVCKLDIM